MDITEQLLKIIDAKTSNVLSRRAYYPHEDFHRITFFTIKGYLSVDLECSQYLRYYLGQSPFIDKKDLYKVLGIHLYRWWNPLRSFDITGDMCNWADIRTKVNKILMGIHQKHQDEFTRKHNKRAAQTEKVLKKL